MIASIANKVSRENIANGMRTSCVLEWVDGLSARARSLASI